MKAENSWDIKEEIIQFWKEELSKEGYYQIVASWDEIRDRISSLAEEINQHYEGMVSQDNPLVLICVLTGALYFFSELAKRLEIPVKFEFMDVSSYSGRSSTGVIKIEKDLDTNIEGKHVLIVEDIIDTGYTLDYLVSFLSSRNPASLKVCVMFDKREARKKDVKVDFRGMVVPNKFLVGFGLDYDEYYRNVPFVVAYEE